MGDSRTRCLPPLFVLALLATAPLAAQQPTAVGSVPATGVERPPGSALAARGGDPLAVDSAAAGGQTHPALLTGAGLLGGTAGFFAGGLVGGNVACAGDDHDDFCGLIGGFWGAAVGTSVGIPLAVHLANGRRGNYGRSQLVSAGIAAGLIGALLMADDEDTAAAILLPVIPAAQILSSILIERRTASRDPGGG